MNQILVIAMLAISVAGQTDYDPCTGLYEGFKPDLRDCSFYWACGNGKGYKYQCPEDRIFDEAQGACKLGDPATDCPAPFCPEGDTGVYSQRVNGQCQKYRTCLDGFIVDGDCGTGYAFDDVSGKCDVELKADCLNCPAEDLVVVVYPNKKNCGAYYVCSSGNPFELFCAEGLHYDEEQRRCIDETLFECPYLDYHTDKPDPGEPSCEEGEEGCEEPEEPSCEEGEEGCEEPGEPSCEEGEEGCEEPGEPSCEEGEEGCEEPGEPSCEEGEEGCEEPGEPSCEEGEEGCEEPGEPSCEEGEEGCEEPGEPSCEEGEEGCEEPGEPSCEEGEEGCEEPGEPE